VPARVLAAIGQATIDHRSPSLEALVAELLPALRRLFRTEADVVVYTASGTGAWEAAFANLFSPGEAILAFDNGHFARLWADLGEAFGLQVERVPGDWRRGPDAEGLHAALSEDGAHRIRAVTVVHNETSTGVTARIPEIRRAIDAAAHPALLLVDTISSLGSIDYRHDEWGVDVTIAASQKGLMLPPGLAFNALGARAREAAREASLPRSYWAWEAMLESNEALRFPYTPSTNMLFGLREALSLLEAETLEAVFERHRRHAEATRRAVRAWGLEVYAQREQEQSSSLTAVLVPDAVDADEVRSLVLDRFDMSLGAGLGPLQGRVFRIGHLGDLNDLTLAGALCGVEMGLRLAGMPHRPAGVAAALDYLSEESGKAGG
jgi:alanine-glyoxylate transaminase/serine-glyoxylate transaminase/serine-pyruvate transaminase